MTRWHSVPAELYAVVEHTPATVLLESAPPSPADSSSGRASQTRLFTAPLRVLVTNNPEELPNLFAEIERAVSTGLYAAGYFSYECGAFFEPKAAPVISSSQSPQQPLAQPLAWFGIYLSPYVFDHATGAFLADNLPPLAKHPAPQGPDPVLNCTIHPTEQQYASASIKSTPSSAPATSISSTSPFPSRSTPPAAPPPSIAACAVFNRPPTARSFTPNPTTASFPSRPSSSFG